MLRGDEVIDFAPGVCTPTVIFRILTRKTERMAPRLDRFLNKGALILPLLWAVLFLSAPSSASAFQQDSGDQVWDVVMEGNESFSDLVLKDQIATGEYNFWEKLRFWNRGAHPLAELDVRKDVIRLRNYYRRRGFVNAEVSYRVETLSKEWKKRVVFSVVERSPVTIGSVEFVFPDTKEDTATIRRSDAYRRAVRSHAYRPGNRYETVREPEVSGRFNDVLRNLGYAYSEVEISAAVDTSRLRADLRIICRTGPRTYFDRIGVEGNESVSEDFVIRETGLQEGQSYSLNQMQEAQRELFNHHLFRFATISIPDQEADSTLELLVRLRENPPRSVEASAGFGTEEKLRGQLSWTHRNVFGRGHRFTATGRASFIEQTLSLDYMFPRVYNTRSSIVISPFAQHLLESGFELYRTGINNSFIYRYDQYTTASATYQFTNNLELSRQFDASLPDTTQEYDLSSFQVSGYYNETLGRDQEGWSFQPLAEISGLFGSATFGFQKLSFDLRRFTRLSPSTMLATRIQTGGLTGASADSLPRNSLYFLGGTNSVRGWNRQYLGPKRVISDSTGFRQYVPAGGRVMMGFNIEVRQELDMLIEGLGTAVFLDGGQVWSSFGSLSSRPVQFGAGGGLRYLSPIGPLRVDVGYKINPTQADLNRYQGVDYGGAWDRIGIHFSIGQAF